MKPSTALFAITGLLLSATPALAASDMFLKLDGVDGEAAIESWSFGTCSSGQCVTISTPTEAGKAKAGKTGKPSNANWDLATGKGARTSSKVNVAVGDVDGDGRADLAYAGTLDKVNALALTVSNADTALLRVCGGKHIAKAVLKIGADSYDLTDAAITCASVADAAAARAINPGRSDIVSNIPVPKQTQGATFGEKVQAGLATGSSVTVTFTGGQMKHTKTGHVTILK